MVAADLISQLPRPEYAKAHKRDEATALAYLSGQHTMAKIAEHFGVHYTTISRVVKAYEAGDSQRGMLD